MRKNYLDLQIPKGFYVDPGSLIPDTHWVFRDGTVIALGRMRKMSDGSWHAKLGDPWGYRELGEFRSAQEAFDAIIRESKSDHA